MTRAAWLNALLAAAVAALALFIHFKQGSEAPAEHALGALKPDDAGSIVIERGGEQLAMLERKGDAWFITSPLAARADPLLVQRLLAIAEAKSAHRLAATDLARFELERPAARLTVGAQQFDFGMVNEIAREQYVLTGGAVYTVGLRYGAALPARARDLIDKRLLGTGEIPVGIALREHVLARQDGRWTLAPARENLSQDDLQRWADDWRHASAARVEPYLKGKAAPDITLEFKDGGKTALAILAREPELALLRQDEKLVYYFLKGHGQRLLVPPAPKE